MSSTPEFNGEQLSAARAGRWHQNGDALLTFEAAREWLGELGLVLFAPRAQQLPTPAPSLVEATLGRPAEAPTAAEGETARGLVARLVADGSALPLNLLGSPGDHPDFIVSAQVFSYVFTLRGDKAWKQPPSASGTVSPLAAKVYDVVAERGALTAAELVSELGRELTENAIARALSELWTQLRTIPLLQQDGSATLWELTSRRFTKAIKAGANAGQPTALSALVSLYLAQSYAATEEEIETFLSTLAARSRVRDVLHGLTAGRQLDSVVLEGKTLLYIPGALPEFPAIAAAGAAQPAPAEAPKKVGTGRIRSFAGDHESGRELRGKPARSFAAGRSREGGTRPTRHFAAPADGASERERRPFRREGGGAQKPSFTRPWNEERPPRERAEHGGGAEERPARPRFNREEGAGRAPAKRPYKPREDAGGRGGFKARGGAGERGTFKPRRFEAGGEGGARDRGRKPGGFGGKRPYAPRESGGEQRPSAKPPYIRREGEGGERPFAKRPYTPRPAEGGERGADRGRSAGARPGGFASKRPYKPRDTEAGERPFAKRPYTPRGAEEGGRPAAKRPFKPRNEGGFDRGGAPAKKGFGAKRFGARQAGNFGARPGGKAGGKPGGKSGARPGEKPAGNFGPRKFGAKPGGFGAKRSGAAGGKRPGPRKPEAEE